MSDEEGQRPARKSIYRVNLIVEKIDGSGVGSYIHRDVVATFVGNDGKDEARAFWQTLRDICAEIAK